MGLFFLDAEILAGNQKILLPRQKKNPKTSPRKRRCWAVSIPKQGPIIYRAVSALSAWDLRVRMFISLISYVLYVLSARHHKLEKKEGRQQKKESECRPVLRKFTLDFAHLTLQYCCSL